MSDTANISGKRVLVVEDDYYLASDEAGVLERAGATVVGCTGDAGEAARLIGSEAIDCALVDINLGSGPAFDTARALAAKNIPFLFTTGYDAGAIPEEYRGVTRLEKPFGRDQLLTTLRKIL